MGPLFIRSAPFRLFYRLTSGQKEIRQNRSTYSDGTMKNKDKFIRDSDIDKALAKAASSNPKKLKTDEPLSEKDEVKQAEEELRQRLNKNKKER